jgi:hypothetical protein
MNSKKETKMTPTIKTLKILIFILCSVIVLFSSILIIGNIDTYIHRNDWKDRTSPLPVLTIRTLCKNFELANTSPLCEENKNIYSRDFYKAIIAYFRPYENEKNTVGTATYSLVEENIGEYKIKCESVTTNSDGFSNFRCFYDIRGDNVFIMVIWFTYPDNLVFRIMTPMGEDN